nr:unnamed protein product [Callosobruchus chinensis]
MQSREEQFHSSVTRP